MVAGETRNVEPLKREGGPGPVLGIPWLGKFDARAVQRMHVHRQAGALADRVLEHFDRHHLGFLAAHIDPNGGVGTVTRATRTAAHDAPPVDVSAKADVRGLRALGKLK